MPKKGSRQYLLWRYAGGSCEPLAVYKTYDGAITGLLEKIAGWVAQKQPPFKEITNIDGELLVMRNSKGDSFYVAAIDYFPY